MIFWENPSVHPSINKINKYKINKVSTKNILNNKILKKVISKKMSVFFCLYCNVTLAPPGGDIRETFAVKWKNSNCWSIFLIVVREHPSIHLFKKQKQRIKNKNCKKKCRHCFLNKLKKWKISLKSEFISDYLYLLLLWVHLVVTWGKYLQLNGHFKLVGLFSCFQFLTNCSFIRSKKKKRVKLFQKLTRKKKLTIYLNDYSSHYFFSRYNNKITRITRIKS